jgi:DNA-3-methyladenine glycosylase I
LVGDDGVTRCPWAAATPLLTDYHDTEWGRPVRGEQALYERVVLEGFQAGLSWLTILTKRPAFRAAFHDFDPDVVAALSDRDLDGLMGNAAIVRNRAKIEAARTNARAVVALRARGGIDELIWSHQPLESPAPRRSSEVPTSSPESKALAKALRSHGFRFVGPTTVFALMEAIGMIDTHLVDCHCRRL